MSRGPEGIAEQVCGTTKAGNDFLPEASTVVDAGSPLILRPEIPLAGGMRVVGIGFVNQVWGKGRGENGKENGRTTVPGVEL